MHTDDLDFRLTGGGRSPVLGISRSPALRHSSEYLNGHDGLTQEYCTSTRPSLEC